LLIFAAATTVGAAAAAPDASSPPVVIVHEPHLTGYHMPSASMEPTLQCAHPAPGCEAAYPDRLVVQSLKRAPQRGDILVFRAPALARVRCAATGTYVKRLIGLPGETVSERDGVISIDGKKLVEPYIKRNRRDTVLHGTWHIPRDRNFVLGDNRALSCDSRIWGSVPSADLIGKVVLIYRQR